eukprot:SAG22_NODE_404_length_11005_cov_8.751788_6_plen_103_part_00
MDGRTDRLTIQPKPVSCAEIIDLSDSARIGSVEPMSPFQSDVPYFHWPIQPPRGSKIPASLSPLSARPSWNSCGHSTSKSAPAEREWAGVGKSASSAVRWLD